MLAVTVKVQDGGTEILAGFRDTALYEAFSMHIAEYILMQKAGDIDLIDIPDDTVMTYKVRLNVHSSGWDMGFNRDDLFSRCIPVMFSLAGKGEEPAVMISRRPQEEDDGF